MATSYQIRKAKGLCTKCGSTRDNETQKCSGCREKDNLQNKKSMQRLRDKRVDKSQCICCGANCDNYTCDLCGQRCRSYQKQPSNRNRSRARQRERESSDAQFKLRRRLRSRFTQAIKGSYKAGSAVHDLGCSIEFLKQYLESQFQDGMTWDNHGKWHIDHIKPLSSFDLQDREDLLEACHYTNLQPLWAKDNLRKGDKYDF